MPPVMAQEMLQSLGAGEGQVSIVAWAGYLERGETDPAFDWVTKFEADTGAFYKKVVEMAEGSLKTGEEGLETLKSMPFVMTGQYQTLTAELATDLRAQ